MLKNYQIEIETKNIYGVGKLTHGSKEDDAVKALNEAIEVLRSFDSTSIITSIKVKKL
jgi:hypothetical protein